MCRGIQKSILAAAFVILQKRATKKSTELVLRSPVLSVWKLTLVLWVRDKLSKKIQSNARKAGDTLLDTLQEEEAGQVADEGGLDVEFEDQE